MSRTGSVYVSVHSAGLVTIMSVNLTEETLVVEHSIFDEKPYKEKISLKKFNWAIDRSDLVLKKTIAKEDVWMLNEIKRVLKDSFGLQSILRSTDPQRVSSGVDVLRSKTGFRKAYIYSILETIRELQL